LIVCGTGDSDPDHRGRARRTRRPVSTVSTVVRLRTCPAGKTRRCCQRRDTPPQ
jgi:hypothetical protein